MALMNREFPIIGHKLQLTQLQADLTQGNVAHAYLFAGPAQVGKMTVARQFACSVLGIDAFRLTHPDLLVLDQLWIDGQCDDWDTIARTSNVPQRHRSKAPTAKTDTIGIDDIRALQERLIETGTGVHRCCIIRNVERMQDAAANAFLKILEEPPAGLVFLLTSEAQSSLLPTIISRTRVLPFRRIGGKEIASLLDGISEEDKVFILHIANGAPGFAVQLRDDPELLRYHRTVHGTAQSFWQSSSFAQQLQILRPLTQKDAEAEHLLLHLGLTLRTQPAELVTRSMPAYQKLVSALQTNAHRQLLTQRFTLDIATV